MLLRCSRVRALRLRDLPASDQGDSDCRNRAFCQLDKNGDGRISIEELTEVMEDLGAGGKDAEELMHLLDADSDGSLTQMNSRHSRDRKILKEKSCRQLTARVSFRYRKELGDKLLVS
ncbi:hypothetical protein GUJ93_ZPchr0149g29149 [Zizania palustris]|uniref:EF-hand domain-containing protein n=1 Tax=Zizania palustris TaxID=103762 RepID=A0A8J5RRI4_ZIZPA|nr:hypothetical protein GUJ93_ZPchr0149g29149 [Zizania palustris]